MSAQAPQSLKLVLSNREGLGKITVDLEPFFDFSFWLAEELQDLVATQKRAHPIHRPPAVRSGTRR